MTASRAIGIALLVVLSISPLSVHADWVKATNAIHSNVVVASIGTDFLAAGDSSAVGMFRSTDNGVTWSASNTGMPPNQFIYNFAVDGSTMFAGAYYGGIYRTRDHGAHWDSVNATLPTATIAALAANGGKLYAQVFDSVYVTSNEGDRWSALGRGYPPTSFFRCFAFTPTAMLGGTNGGGIYRSSDQGSSWTMVTDGFPSDVLVPAIAVVGNTILASTSAGMYRSTDDGLHWSAAGTGMATYGPSAIATISGNVFVGTYGGGLYRTTNLGDKWDSVNAGLPSGSVIFSLATNGTDLIIGTYNDGIWRRALSEFGITAVDASAPALPATLALQQNYPNPFRDETTIRYTLPASGRVSCTVWNALGEMIASPLNDVQQPGAHSVSVQLPNLQSGVYTYRVAAGGEVRVGRMCIVK